MRRPTLVSAAFAALLLAACEDIVVPIGSEDPRDDAQQADTGPDAAAECIVDADCADVTPPDCQRMVCKAGTCQATSDASRDGQVCGEADLCLSDGVCQAGVCVGTAKDCSELTTGCVIGVCAPGTGECQPLLADDGEACEDGDPCTTGETCSDGTCVGGQPLDCSSLDGPCLAGQCEGGTCRAEPTVDAACDSGDPCIPAATCDEDAQCVGAFDKDVPGCSEGMPCITNADCGAPAVACRPLFCDGTTCVATQTSGTCYIDGQCYPDGTPDPAGGCGSCMADVDPTVWTCDPCGNGALNAGEECDDGNQEDGDGCSSTCRLEPTCLVTYGTSQTGVGRAMLIVVAPGGAASVASIAPLGFTANPGAGRRSFARCGGFTWLAGGAGGLARLAVQGAETLTATTAATFTEPHALACRETEGTPVLYVAERTSANVGRFSRHAISAEGKIAELDAVEVTFPSDVARLDFVDGDKAGLLLLARSTAGVAAPVTFAARFLPNGTQQGAPLALLDNVAARVDFDPTLGGLLAVGFQGGCLGFAPFGAGAALPGPKDFTATCPPTSGFTGSDFLSALGSAGVGFFSGYATAPLLAVVEPNGKGGFAIGGPVKLSIATAPVLLAPAHLGRTLVAISASGSSVQVLDVSNPAAPESVSQATPPADSTYAIVPVPCGL